jgi:hypothetical protein
VGSYAPNKLGLYDMHGNVWEWCEDTFQGTDRVCRGGSWLHLSESCRAARFYATSPSYRTTSLGLRLARVPSGAPSPEAKTPAAVANVLKDAVLVMNFEKDTFYEKDGKTYVRDLSGNGNDGLCENVEFVPEGKAGGGLACKGGSLQLAKSLISRQPNYTIALWGRAERIGANVPKERLYSTARPEFREQLVFQIGLPPERSVHVNAFNRAKPDKWVAANSKANVIPEGEWYFLAVTLSGGGVEKGELRVTVNDTVILLSSQMVDSDGLVDMLGHAMTGCVLDEFAVFQRALTVEEIAAVRSLGLKGTPLDVGKAPPPAAVAPFTDADVQRIAALPAAEQVEEVRKELMRRNPGFDGTMQHKIENDVVTELRVVTDQVTDIAPIRVFNALRVLDCSGTYTDKPNGLLADLTPLGGMNLARLTHLDLHNTMVTDAGTAHFKGCKDLTFLYLNGTKVTDRGLAHFNNCKNLTFLSLGGTGVSDAGLIHFRDCKDLTYLNLGWTNAGDAGVTHFQGCKGLNELDLAGTKVGDAGLTSFKGMPLKSLWIFKTDVTDLTPFQGMPLEEIRLTPKSITRGLEILRDMKGLKTIGVESNQSWPAAEFWERYDKGEFKE